MYCGHHDIVCEDIRIQCIPEVWTSDPLVCCNWKAVHRGTMQARWISSSCISLVLLKREKDDSSAGESCWRPYELPQIIIWRTWLVVSYLGLAQGWWRWSMPEGQVGRASVPGLWVRLRSCMQCWGACAPAAMFPFYWKLVSLVGACILFPDWKSGKCSWIQNAMGFSLLMAVGNWIQ